MNKSSKTVIVLCLMLSLFTFSGCSLQEVTDLLDRFDMEDVKEKQAEQERIQRQIDKELEALVDQLIVDNDGSPVINIGPVEKEELVKLATGIRNACSTSRFRDDYYEVMSINFDEWFVPSDDRTYNIIASNYARIITLLNETTYDGREDYDKHKLRNTFKYLKVRYRSRIFTDSKGINSYYYEYYNY